MEVKLRSLRTSRTVLLRLLPDPIIFPRSAAALRWRGREVRYGERFDGLGGWFSGRGRPPGG